MTDTIGIRYEDKYLMEHRVALTPEHVKQLSSKGLKFRVKNSAKRVFTDDEYREVGAEIVEDVRDIPLVLGVKEMPIDFFRKDGSYIFFSHVIKGQQYNMPMLKRMMELKCNLIDYEKITNEKGQRLIFFGRFAGLAGMINSLWTAGLRYKHQGIETPFIQVKQSHTYPSLKAAEDCIKKVANHIKTEGLPQEICPFVIGVTGYGNVSKGAQEIIDILPTKEISPEELLKLKSQKEFSNKVIYKVVFKEEKLSKRKDNQPFELQTYYNHPELFESDFEQYLDHISILMNCMYWDEKYPRIVTREWLKNAYSNNNQPKLNCIGDVTCDPGGSIEATVKGTYIEDPIFVYDPFSGEIESGFTGKGIQVMAVDILPSELPRESSEAFSDALVNYVEEIAATDFDQDFENLTLPAPIKRALILHKGELTPDFKYIEEYL